MRIGTNGILDDGVAAALFDFRKVIETLFGEEAFDVVPGRLIIGRFCNPAEGRVDFLLERGQVRRVNKDIVTLIPGRIVAIILIQKKIQKSQLIVPQIEVFNDPLTIGPCVVIFRVSLNETRRKIEFT